MNKFCQFLKDICSDVEEPKPLIGKKIKFTEKNEIRINTDLVDNVRLILKPGTYIGTIRGYWPSKSGKCMYSIIMDVSDVLALTFHLTFEKDEKVEILQ